MQTPGGTKGRQKGDDHGFSIRILSVAYKLEEPSILCTGRGLNLRVILDAMPLSALEFCNKFESRAQSGWSEQPARAAGKPELQTGAAGARGWRRRAGRAPNTK
jgi:hypothetical protein